MEIELATRLSGVTVFPDQAQVTRTGEVEVPSAGEHLLRVDGLPLGLWAQSLRATGRGPAGTRLLSVEQTRAMNPAAPEADLTALREELERQERVVSLLDERLKALDEREAWLKNLGHEMTHSLAKSIARGTAKTEDASGFFTFADEQATQIATSRLDIQRQRTEAQRALDAKRRDYSQRGGQRQPDRITAQVRIQTATAGTVSIALSYLIHGASWHPRYDARVDTEARTVKLTQQAVVTQSTGEAWSNVELALSTARPSAAVRLPDEPDPWFVDIARPLPPPAPMMARAAKASASLGAVGGIGEEMADAIAPIMPLAAPMPQGAPMAVASVGMDRAGAAQVFRLPGGADVPSDGSPHILSLGDSDLPAQLDYVTQPARTPGAHLRAVAINEAGRVLLPGELHIFHSGTAGDEYVGQTAIELTAEHAEMPLYLGVDDNVRVKHEMVERDTDKGNLLQRGVRKTTYGYRVTISNHTGSAQRIVLKDCLPVPRNEKIRVTVLEMRPQPSERTKLEQLTWALSLAPGEEKPVEWRFTVEMPNDAPVIGLP
ncbi:MAG TPA: mucoidy inhibitor MuiA family protein [Ktedonobacterales bacterium]